MTDAIRTPIWNAAKRVTAVILACLVVLALGFGSRAARADDPALVEPTTPRTSQVVSSFRA